MHKNDCNCNVALNQTNCMVHLKKEQVSIVRNYMNEVHSNFTYTKTGQF